MKKQFLIATALCITALNCFGCSSKEATTPSATETAAVTTQAATEETTAEETTAETTEEATEETTEKATEESTSEAAEETTAEANSQTADALSSDLYSFQIQVNDDFFQFPMTYADVVAKGWIYDGDDTQPLDAHYKAPLGVFDKGKSSIYFSVFNADVNALPYNQCLVGGCDIDDYMAKGATITLPGGITLGKSTVDDIKNAYGTPSSDSTTSRGTVNLEYSLDYQQTIRLTISAETQALSKIHMENYVIPDDFEASEVSSDVPEIVSKYQAPEAMSDDLSDFIVNYGDVLYRLPAPVSEFEANGWKVLEDKSETQVAGRGFGWVTMTKDNQKLKVLANNYSDQATSIHNCFVTTVLSDDYTTKTPLTIARNITIGMSKEALENALSGIEYTTEEGSTSICYKVSVGNRTMDRYEIYTHKSDSKVYKIEADNTPKFDTIEKWLAK